MWPPNEASLTRTTLSYRSCTPGTLSPRASGFWLSPATSLGARSRGRRQTSRSLCRRSTTSSLTCSPKSMSTARRLTPCSSTSNSSRRGRWETFSNGTSASFWLTRTVSL